MNTQGKIIGIYGHKGAGKMSVGWLLAHCLENRMIGREVSREYYQNLCDAIKADPRAARLCELRRVYLTEFQEGLLVYISMFLGVSANDLMDPSWTRNRWVSLSRGNVTDSLPQNALVHDARSLAKVRSGEIMMLSTGLKSKPFGENEYMRVDEYIMYFAYYMVQGMLGPDVWLNDLRSSDRSMGERMEPTIFMDVKTLSELEYIKERGGILVKVTREGHYTVDTLCNEQASWTDYQFQVSLEEDNLGASYEQVLNIADTLIEIWTKEEDSYKSADFT